VGALAQDAPDWWGWGGGGLVGGVAPNSSASSSYVRKRTGILSGGDAWQRFTRTQSGMGSSDSESEVESHRSATLSGQHASKGSPFWSGGNMHFEAGEQPKRLSDWGEDEGCVSTLEPPSRAAAATLQAKTAQSRHQRKEAELFAHIRAKLKHLALHHARHHMNAHMGTEHSAHEHEHVHAQQVQMQTAQQQEQQMQTQTQPAMVGEHVVEGSLPGSQQLRPPSSSAEEEACELASAVQRIYEHAQEAEALCEQEEQASAAQLIHEHAQVADVQCEQEELASLFDLPPEVDSSAEAATQAILHPFSALHPTQPQALDSSMVNLCTPPTPPMSNSSLPSHNQHIQASSQQQHQQHNSHSSLLSVSQQELQQQPNLHSSLLSVSQYGSGRSCRTLSPAQGPLQPTSASLFIHGRSSHPSMELEEEPEDIDVNGYLRAYRRIDTMHARLPDSPKLSYSETPVLGGSSGSSSLGQHGTTAPNSPINPLRSNANASNRRSPISSAPRGGSNQYGGNYGDHSHGLAQLFGAPSPLSSASQVGLEAKSISSRAEYTAPESALGHHPDGADVLASLFRGSPNSNHHKGAGMESPMGLKDSIFVLGMEGEGNAEQGENDTAVVISEESAVGGQAQQHHQHQQQQQGGQDERPQAAVLPRAMRKGEEGAAAFSMERHARDGGGVGAAAEGPVGAAGMLPAATCGMDRGDDSGNANPLSVGVGEEGEEEEEGQGEDAIVAALFSHKLEGLGGDAYAGGSSGRGVGSRGASTSPQRSWQRSLSCAALPASSSGAPVAATAAAAAAAAVEAWAAGTQGQVPISAEPAAPTRTLRDASPPMRAALAARARLQQQNAGLPFRRGHTTDALPRFTPGSAGRGPQERALLVRLLRRQHKRFVQQQYAQAPFRGNPATAHAAGAVPHAASPATAQGGGASTPAALAQQLVTLPHSSHTAPAAAVQAGLTHSAAPTAMTSPALPPHAVPECASQTMPTRALSPSTPAVLTDGSPFSEASPTAPLPALTPASSIPASDTLPPASSVHTTTHTTHTVTSTAPGAIAPVEVAHTPAAAVPDSPGASPSAKGLSPAYSTSSAHAAVSGAAPQRASPSYAGAAPHAPPQAPGGNTSSSSSRMYRAPALSLNGRLRSMLSGGGGPSKRAATKSTSLNRTRVNHIGNSSGSESSSSGSNLVGSLVMRLRNLSRNEAARAQLQQQQQQDQHAYAL